MIPKVDLIECKAVNKTSAINKLIWEFQVNESNYKKKRMLK